ncbi:MAG TPA: MAPEG family protein [Polyangiaceae bacterium]|nr:MAPEG family protein [Polyangiaceae bacterium]
MTVAAPFSPPWFRARKPMILAINIGTGSWAVAAGLCWWLWPEVADRSGVAERLSFAAQLAAGPALVLFVLLCSCFRLFDTERAEDPFAGAESHAWKINQRVLSNTLEQASIFIPALFALATRIDAAKLKALPIAVTLWCTGRLLFWAGYRQSVVWRAPGFEWTFNTSLVVLAWYAVTLF